MCKDFFYNLAARKMCKLLIIVSYEFIHAYVCNSAPQMPSLMNSSLNSGIVMMKQLALRKIYLILTASDFVINISIHLGV